MFWQEACLHPLVYDLNTRSTCETRKRLKDLYYRNRTHAFLKDSAIYWKRYYQRIHVLWPFPRPVEALVTMRLLPRQIECVACVIASFLDKGPRGGCVVMKTSSENGNGWHTGFLLKPSRISKKAQPLGKEFESKSTVVIAKQYVRHYILEARGEYAKSTRGVPHGNRNGDECISGHFRRRCYHASRTRS